MLKEVARTARWAVVGSVIVAALAGCTPHVAAPPVETPQYSDKPQRVLPAQPTPPEARKPQPQEVELGRSVANRPIVAQIYGCGEQTILIMASIHGNETAGTPLVRRLGDYLLQQPQLLEGRRIIILPIANPDGVAMNVRHNLHGVDLNRNFPAWNYSASQRHGNNPLSEPESRVLAKLLDEYAPKRIISIHQPLNCIDYDGSADGVARAMASSSGLPLKKLGSLAGSLGSYAGITKHTGIVTVEFARSADNLSADAIWERYGRMLLVGICYPNSVPTQSPVLATEAPTGQP